MKHYPTSATALVLAFVAAIALTSCASMAPFSQVELDKITALKAESLSLIGTAATSPYTTNQPTAESLKQRLEDAHKASLDREKSDVAKQQWATLKDGSGGLLGGFLARWQNRGTLSATFITEASKIISDAFNELIALENGRRK